MADVKPVEFGNFELYPIEAGRFRLDGGAMFGVVPKTLWSKQIPADDKNRILMGMRCLLIKSKKTDKAYLVDNGSGDKFNDKMASIYDLDYDHSDLISSLKNCGFEPADITDIIFTHLHFDHCGGTTTYNEQGKISEVFPKATYHVNKRHWETANHPNAREKASFFPENLDPIKNSGRLNLVDDYHEFETNLDTLIMNGHTTGQQLPVLRNGETILVYAADLIPTFTHIPLPWVMGYDMKPIQTLEEKEAFLNQAADENWHLFLEHDADHEVVTVQKENGKFMLKNTLSLAEIS
ncbi:MBL fold metallo-hydrolase [Rhodohalobacter sp. 614A]|uniref:MBL fold metallo-hydrolase n=1 Tax=Rhodohalobacter sp. 614A TaxID=2908649 RepID=UPI001F285A4F|nr:MBL fold metallo-hydrolase [Rhodohalobacter sp. 614A]